MVTRVLKLIITVRNSSCGRVMFLHLSVILFTEGGVVYTPAWADTPPWADNPSLGSALGRPPTPGH